MASRDPNPAAKRPVIATSVAGILIIVAHIAASLALMPVLLNHVGLGGLGLWLVAMSLFSFTHVMSVALCGGVVTALSKASRRDDQIRISAAATAASTITALVLGVTVLPLVGLIDWHAALSPGTDVSPTDTQRTIWAVAIIVALALPLQLAKHLLLGLSRGHVGYLAEAAGIVMAAVLVWIGVMTGAPLFVLVTVFGLLPMLVICVVGGVALARSGIFVWQPDLAELRRAPWIWRQGGHLGLSQLASSSINPADLLIIGLILGTTYNAAFGAVQQVMLLPTVFVAIISSAFWPRFAQAHAQGESETLRRSFGKGLLISVSSTLIFVVIAGLIMDFILRIWLRQEIDLPPFIVVGLGAWAVLSSGIGMATTLLRATGHTKLLLVTMVSCAVLKVGLAVLCVSAIGPGGAPIATVFAAILCVGLPMALRVPDIWRAHLATP